MTDMWACPACGRSFANRNQVHTCAALGDLDRHFADSSPQVRATFDAVLAAAGGFGPVEVLAEKTRIALQVRMSFAAFMPRRHWLNGHLVLARRIGSPRFVRIDALSPRNVVHAFRLTAPVEVDGEFTGWLAPAGASSKCGLAIWRPTRILGACQEATLVAGRGARRWCPVSNKFLAAPLSSSIA